MNVKLLLATLAGAVAAFLLGWLFWGVLLTDFFAANTNTFEGLEKEMPNLILMFFSNVVIAFLLGFIFQRWAHISTFVGGLKGGAIIGILIAISYDLSFLSMMNLFNTSAAIVDILTATVWYALIGGVVAFVLGYGKKAEA